MSRDHAPSSSSRYVSICSGSLRRITLGRKRTIEQERGVDTQRSQGECDGGGDGGWERETRRRRGDATATTREKEVGFTSTRAPDITSNGRCISALRKRFAGLYRDRQPRGRVRSSTTSQPDTSVDCCGPGNELGVNAPRRKPRGLHLFALPSARGINENVPGCPGARAVPHLFSRAPSRDGISNKERDACQLRADDKIHFTIFCVANSLTSFLDFDIALGPGYSQSDLIFKVVLGFSLDAVRVV